MTTPRSPGSAPLVAVVCTANVCRSVYATGLLSSGPFPRPVTFTSAGVSAHPRLATCPLVADRLAGREVPLPASTPRQLDADLLARADLILTMTAGQRGAVGRMEASARTRTFTLVEACALAEALASRQPAPLDFDAWVEALNALRGRVPMPVRQVKLGRWPRRHTETVLDVDVDDGHTSDKDSAHLATLRMVEDLTTRLAAAARGVLASGRDTERTHP